MDVVLRRDHRGRTARLLAARAQPSERVGALLRRGRGQPWCGALREQPDGGVRPGEVPPVRQLSRNRSRRWLHERRAHVQGRHRRVRRLARTGAQHRAPAVLAAGGARHHHVRPPGHTDAGVGCRRRRTEERPEHQRPRRVHHVEAVLGEAGAQAVRRCARDVGGTTGATAEGRAGGAHHGAEGSA